MKYKISTQFPAGTYNTNIPTSDHSTSRVSKCNDALSAGGTNFPKDNVKGSSGSESQHGPYGSSK